MNMCLLCHCHTVVMTFQDIKKLSKHQCYSCLHKVLCIHSSKITNSLRSVHQSTGSLLTCYSSKVCSCPSKQLLLVVSIIIWSLSSWLLKQYCQASNHCHVSQFQSLTHVTIRLSLLYRLYHLLVFNYLCH